MGQLFTNNARATLTAAITSSTATSFTIDATKADLFPVANVGTGSLPSASNWFKVTLQDSSGNVEIVAVRTRAAGSAILSNVIRGYDGTTARTSFAAGTIVGLRLTAADVQTSLALPSQNNVFSGDNSFSGANEFTDTITAPTMASGNSSTNVATTAFVQTALRTLYPVGSIYINAGVTTNPATLLGFGTWTAFGAGRVMVGLNGSDTLFDALEESGGSKDAVTVSHTHTTASAGSHQHFEFSAETVVESGVISNTTSVARNATQGGSTFESYELRPGTVDATVGLSSTAASHTHSVNSTGSSGTNANLQPYITVAMWKRTA